MKKHQKYEGGTGSVPHYHTWVIAIISRWYRIFGKLKRGEFRELFSVVGSISPEPIFYEKFNVGILRNLMPELIEPLKYK